MRARLCICLAITLTLATTVPAQHTPARVAIYKDVGVWANEGERALPAVLEWLGATYRWVSARDINTGALNKSGKPAFDLLIVPGGWAGDYISRVGGWSGKGPGDDEVRAFVAGGGGYLGFCAGAFAAATTTRWLGRNIAYSWKLFDGVAEGPLPWNPLLGRLLRAGHGTAALDLNAPELKGRGLPATVRPMLYGGPRFILRDPKSPPASYRVLAKHGEDNSAAIVSYRYPNANGGRVVLSSFHPSVLTGDGALFDRDHDTFTAVGAVADPDGHAPDWRLVAALIDVALGRAARKAPALPRAAGWVSLPSVLGLGRGNAITLTQGNSGGAEFALAASLSTVPGTRIATGVILPLTVDAVLLASLQTPSVFAGFFGRLDSKGKATAALNVPAIVSLRGIRLHFAFVTRDASGWLATSAPASAAIF
jgi:glutamine amidotransferase-like uncharacterized protein